MIFWLEFVASLATLSGVVLLAWKMRAGWLVQVCGCALWIAWGALTGAVSLLALNVVICGWSAWGWRNWRRPNG